jgi:lipid A 3-O-deacylase
LDQYLVENSLPEGGRVIQIIKTLFALILLILLCDDLLADEFYLDSPRNKGILRIEIDNDLVWGDDSNFTSGLSIQYHTACYRGWNNTETLGLIKWVGKHFPTLNDNDSIVRNSHGIGQNMITPGDTESEIPQEGDLPYAGTLTYTLSWQSFNRENARNFQVSVGVLGQESFAGQLQKFMHNDLGLGHGPQGWNTQRDTEPLLNIGYQYAWCIANLGEYQNKWAGQLTLAPSASLGNLFTAVEFIAAFRFGWNIPEGFASYPAPQGIGFLQSSYLPKPSSASPHAFEMIINVSGTGLLYSVIYDGSFITDDDRDVKRNGCYISAGIGIAYHYYDFFSIRAFVQKSTDLLDKNSLPTPPAGRRKTEADISFGSLIVDFLF